MIKDNNTKELFEFIRTVNTKNVPSLKDILSQYEINKLSVEDVLQNLKEDCENILLIDARSEKEFEETSLPSSINFPVLNTFERHNTGLIYKKYSQSSALWLAMQYANTKSEELKLFLESKKASQKMIFVYCWRGGGRSGYLAKMISDLGYKPSTLTGGYKSYRKKVNDFFSLKEFPFELLELSGLTGSGKTELLRSLKNDLPVIDLEDAARHYSSLLGQIPYDINNIKPVQNQTAFENNLFSQIYFNSHVQSDSTHSTHSTHSTLSTLSPLLIESESKKVGNFEIPKYLYEKLQHAQSVKITSSIDSRVRRIVKDYFGNDLRGIEPMKRLMTSKTGFFRQQLSNAIFDELMQLLDSERVYEFTEIMIKEYYDKKYKDKGKKPLAEISTDNIHSAVKELKEFYKKIAYN